MNVDAASDTRPEHKPQAPEQAFETPDRNVYILGAGFSAPAGAPLIHDFLDRSRSFLDEPMGLLGESNRSQRAPFQEVFKYRKEMARAPEKVLIDLDNIEELFGLVEMTLRLDPSQQPIRDSTALMISRTLEWTTADTTVRPQVQIAPFPGGGGWFLKQGFLPGSIQANTTGAVHSVQMDMYTYFAALVAGLLDGPNQRRLRRDCVITFNYDLVLDYALHQVGVPPDYHLLSPVEDPNWTPPPRRCSFFKLHGSTGWGVCSKCHALRIAQYSRPPTEPMWYPLQRCAQCREQPYLPLLVPPSWDKTGHRDILAPVWARAVEELKAAKRICVIGYSMPKSDSFFKYLLALALAENDRLSDLIVVDMGSAVRARWQEFLEPIFLQRRFHFHPEGLATYLLGKKTLEQLGRGEVLSGKTCVLTTMGA
jgi:hypothetical protein